MTVTSLRRKPTWVQRTPDAPAVAVAGSPAVEPVEPTAPEAPPPSPLSDEVSDAGQVIGIVETMVRDGRSREGLMAAAEDDRLRQRTLDALREAGAAHDEDTVKEVASLAAQSNEQIEDAFASLLNSGRILNRIQAKIGPGGYKALFEAGIVNINMPTASKLRTIASAFDDGRIPKELQRYMPSTLKGAYVIARLPKEVAAQAVRTLVEQQVLPSAPVPQLQEHIRRITMRAGVKNHPEEADGAAAGPADDAAKRYARLSALVARKCEVRAKLDREIDDLDTQLRGLAREFPGLSNPKD